MIQRPGPTGPVGNGFRAMEPPHRSCGLPLEVLQGQPGFQQAKAGQMAALSWNGRSDPQGWAPAQLRSLDDEVGLDCGPPSLPPESALKPRPRTLKIEIPAGGLVGIRVSPQRGEPRYGQAARVVAGISDGHRPWCARRAASCCWGLQQHRRGSVLNSRGLVSRRARAIRYPSTPWRVVPRF